MKNTLSEIKPAKTGKEIGNCWFSESRFLKQKHNKKS